MKTKKNQNKTSLDVKEKASELVIFLLEKLKTENLTNEQKIEVIKILLPYVLMPYENNIKIHIFKQKKI